MPDFRLPANALEYAVLTALWDLRAATVRELHERIGIPHGRVYTTTAKAVDRLRDKGLIERRREDGGFVYRPTIERGKVDNARAHQLLSRFLGAGPHAAAAALVDAADQIDPHLLDELERLIRTKRRSRDGS